MGLDMYLERRSYVKNWDFKGPEERFDVQVKRDGKTPGGIEPSRITYITEEMGYWRKANAIHQWFVDNCADGVDECQPIYVEIDMLKKLKEVCIEVRDSIIGKPLVDKEVVIGWGPEGDMKGTHKVYASFYTKLAEELLPTQEGFFFGNTEYDEYYLEMLEDTIRIIDDCLAAEEKAEQDKVWSDFYYQASW